MSAFSAKQAIALVVGSTPALLCDDTSVSSKLDAGHVHKTDVQIGLMGTVTHPMASQLAQLLSDSDLEELEEVVSRWLKDAPSEPVHHHYKILGERLLQLKRELSVLPQPPQREDLEIALSMMLNFASSRLGPLG